MQLAGSKDGDWLYTDRQPSSKMEIPAASLEAVEPRLGPSLFPATPRRTSPDGHVGLFNSIPKEPETQNLWK